jgi:hypothetical protein
MERNISSKYNETDTFLITRISNNNMETKRYILHENMETERNILNNNWNNYMQPEWNNNMETERNT